MIFIEGSFKEVNWSIRWQMKSRHKCGGFLGPSGPSQSPGFARVQEEIKMCRKKVRWNVNGHHFLSAAFHHSPGNGEFDMNIYTLTMSCPETWLTPSCSLCFWFPSAIFLCCTVFLPAVKMRTADGQEINLCLWGFYVFVCFDVYCSTVVSPPTARGKVFVKVLHLSLCHRWQEYKTRCCGQVAATTAALKLKVVFLLKCKWNVNQIFPSLQTKCC